LVANEKVLIEDCGCPELLVSLGRMHWLEISMVSPDFLNLVEFKKDLRSSKPEEVVQKYLFDRSPYCFADKPQRYIDFRKEICEKFKIHLQNFAIVGSSKVGFSLNPTKFGTVFSESSDVDVVLVSEELFQNLWIDLIRFQRDEFTFLPDQCKKRFNELQYILFWGQVRMDKLPDEFTAAKEWWEFFNRLSTDPRFGPRRVRAMIFKTWKHVSFYYEKNIRELMEIEIKK